MWLLKPLLMTSQSFSQNVSVLGCGAVAVDYIALVSSFPTADSKIRTEKLDILGGGNVGNTLTCLSRLGIQTKVVSKVGQDGNGRFIIDGLISEGIDASNVLMSPKTASPFTYVIVDKSNASRTCIHTPLTDELLPEEISESLLDNISLLHCDSRMTQAAVKLARMAKSNGIPILIDAEKDRPHFSELLPFADYLVTNSAFPTLYTGISERKSAMRKLFEITSSKFIISTLGSEGSILAMKDPLPWAGFMDYSAAAEKLVKFTVDRDGDMRLIHCSAVDAPKENIVDTTGAGDTFIGAVIYGILRKMPAAEFLALGSYMASEKLKRTGARAGIPTMVELLDKVPYILSR